MKKISIILTALVMLFATSAFAAEGDNVTASVKAGFKKDFSTAANVAWEKISDFYFAEFVVNGKSMSAGYNEEGQLVATSKLIATSELPSDISSAITEKYSGYKLSASTSVVNYEGSDSYYLTVENEKQTIKLKCNAVGISVVKKTNK